MADFHLPPDFADLPVERATRLVALACLRAAIAARERLADPKDHEALHDFRVAIRRLRNWLGAYRSVLGEDLSRKSRRHLRSLADATSAARDLAVQIAGLREAERETDAHRSGGVARLRARLDRQQRAAGHALCAAVAHEFDPLAARLERALPVYTLTMYIDAASSPQPMRWAAADALRDAAERFRKRLSKISSAVDQPAAHRARIAGKRLRYLLEPFAAAYAEHVDAVVQPLTRLQDTSGQILDARLLLREVLAEAETRTTSDQSRVGLVELAARLRQRDADAIAALDRDWLGAHAGGFFEALRSLGAALAAPAPRDQETERKSILRDVPRGRLVWEIDEFIDRELVVAEIELPVEDMPVHPPAWLAPHIVREVTGDIEYLNASVARRRRAPRHPGDGENGDPATGTGP